MAVREREAGEEREYYSLNARAYPKLAPFYELIVFPFARIRREVAAIAGADAHSRVLDVATGTGAQARAFAERAGEVVGVDLSESMLRVARAKSPPANLSFRQADATDLPFQDGSFDVACISFALHEMPRSIRARVLAEMARVTRRDGAIVLVDYRRRAGTLGEVLHQFVKLYERERYVEFVGSDLPGLMRRTGIAVRDDRATLLGVVRIVRGVRV